MQLPPMHEPAAIHRRARKGAPDVIVARGPLVIMAHGLMSLDPKKRRSCWISTSVGELTPSDAEDALRGWSKRH